VEYYFSDVNLATTDHLIRFISKDPDGFVPISVVASFKKIKALVSNHHQLSTILRKSLKLVVSEDGKKVRRQHPLTESDMETLQSRIVIAENLPEDHSYQNLMRLFGAVGSVKTIRTCQPQISNGGASPVSRLSKIENMLFSNKLHAFVEYETVEIAEKAVTELNNERNWRSGLRVRLLLRRASKSMQARGRTFGFEGEGNAEEDDLSISEQLNDKQVEDHCQSTVIISYEQFAEDCINDKEGGARRSRGRGRGKSRSRGQHHNNRGSHVGTPPTSNSMHNEQSTATKQPLGPRMPDGTRGFAMGRGKSVTSDIQ
ncbi:La-related protein like, partial [Thalictrum thalictroides]